jgi:hypothetical protein
LLWLGLFCWLCFISGGGFWGFAHFSWRLQCSSKCL